VTLAPTLRLTGETAEHAEMFFLGIDPGINVARPFRAARAAVAGLKACATVWRA